MHLKFSLLIKLVFSLKFIFAQPDIRFNPFDWNLYGKPGSINSISFGDRYAFIGTSGAGVLRFNINTNRFEEPISIAQGLSANFVTAIHYAKNGMIWVATPSGLQYSFSGYGDWRRVSLESIGIPRNNFINRLGDDGKDIWVESLGMLFRLDGGTGIPIETMTMQNKNISWSSSVNSFNIDFSELLFDYTIMDGWMSTLNELINPEGENVRITTIAENSFNKIIIGCQDGTIFVANKNIRILEPYRFGLSSKDVFSFDGNGSFWVGGRSYGSTSGLSYVDINRNIFDHFYFKNILNVDETPIFSILNDKKMVFFGGDENIITYSKRKDSWRQIYLTSGVRKNFVKDMVNINDRLWIATPNGIQIIDIKTSEIIENDITDFFKNIYINNLLEYRDDLFIATQSGLFIFNNKNDVLYDYNDFGYKDSLFVPPSAQISFSAIAKYKSDIYFSTAESILKLNLTNRKWTNSVSSVIYSGKEVVDFVVDKNDFFIATSDMLIHFDKKNNLPEYYNYNFLSNINKLNIDFRKLWIGTSEGIISYRYK